VFHRNSGKRRGRFNGFSRLTTCAERHRRHFSGRCNANGEVVDAGGSLSFDRYNANQVVQLIGVDDKDSHFAGLAVSDSKEHERNKQRIWVGRDNDGTATLSMMDGAGHARIEMKVPADGAPVINFLDRDGKVQKSIAGADAVKN